jgi:hypothetical protein
MVKNESFLGQRTFYITSSQHWDIFVIKKYHKKVIHVTRLSKPSSLLCSALQNITVSCTRHSDFSCVTAAPTYSILLPNIFPITNYSASLLPKFRRRTFFIFVLQVSENQVPSKYVLGVAS